MESRPRESSRLEWLAGTGASLSIVSCYGTFTIIGLLLLLSVTLTINPGIWARFVSFNWIVEVSGFVGLITAAMWDWRLSKCELPG